MVEPVTEHAAEVAAGQRFQFGENWRRFLLRLNEERIEEAEASLRERFDCENLEGKTFIDVGSGSGLFSLAARRLGARVRSFDYDPQSVGCTSTLKERYFDGDPDWTIERGSVLDVDFLKTLGTYDIVYSYGVLHHTGQMWKALENILLLMQPGGVLFVAIYNDQGQKSVRWLKKKKRYNALPSFLRVPYILSIMAPKHIMMFLISLARLRPQNYFGVWTTRRGMNPWYDMVDWIGGYPFEVAKPEEIVSFYRARGLWLESLMTTLAHGNNEFVFKNYDVPGSNG